MLGEFVVADADDTKYNVGDKIRNPAIFAQYEFATQAMLDSYGLACATISRQFPKVTQQRRTAPRVRIGRVRTLAIRCSIPGPPNWKYPDLFHLHGVWSGGSKRCVSGPQHAPGSHMHAMADGSVRMISDTIDLLTYQAAGSRAGEGHITD